MLGRFPGETIVHDLKPPHPLLTLLEGRALMEAGGLMTLLPLLRLQARKGQGEPVMVLPGFMADDRSTVIIRRFLHAIGYATLPWELGQNRQPMMQYLPVLGERITRLAQEHGRKVRLVGWSRGGIISRELARDLPQLVERVVTIGTPVRGGIAASAIGRWVQQETGLTPAQMTRLTEERSARPIIVPVRAIYSRTDGVVAWKACIDEISRDVRHHEIVGSHVGMGANAEVFRLLPELLVAGN
jgi:pimeloyl-ACP methyl ester carboxylesterase